VSGPPPILAEDQMGPALEIRLASGGLVAWKGSGSARLLVHLRDQKRLRVCRHGTACDERGPEVYGRSADERWAQGHDLEIVIQVLALATTQRPAGHAWSAFAVVADATQVAPRGVGEEDVGPQG
jgi:hypothetical protein